MLTAALAREWLARSGHPDPAQVDPPTVARYAAAMRAGRWRPSVMCLTVTGRLVDGVHRCAAVAISECSITVRVVAGTPC